MSFTVEPVDGGGARPTRTTPHLAALIGVLIGAAVFAGGLAATSGGMRHVLATNGGSCASGGPFEIADGQQCDAGVTWLLMGGVVVMLLGGALLLGASSAYSGSGSMGVPGLLWAALFGLLGYNFIEFSLDPTSAFADDAPQIGLLVPGVVFWLMALPGLLMPVAAFRWRNSDAEHAAVTLKAPPPTIVRANVSSEVREQVPVIPGYRAPDELPLSESARAPLAPWLLALVAGAAGGAVLGMQLVDRAL